MSDIAIRPGVREEALALAEILVAACRAGYREFAPAPVLESLNPAAFARGMAASWDSFQTLVPVDGAGAPLGFVRFGADHSGDLDGGALYGQVRSLYVTPEGSRRGVRGALLGAALEQLDADGLEIVTLWVFQGNHEGRRFYERHGFTATGTTRVEPDWGLPSIRYLRGPAADVGPVDEVVMVASPTEDRNRRTADIDQLPVPRLLERINDQVASTISAPARRAGWRCWTRRSSLPPSASPRSCSWLTWQVGKGRCGEPARGRRTTRRRGRARPPLRSAPPTW